MRRLGGGHAYHGYKVLQMTDFGLLEHLGCYAVATAGGSMQAAADWPMPMQPVSLQLSS